MRRDRSTLDEGYSALHVARHATELFHSPSILFAHQCRWRANTFPGVLAQDEYIIRCLVHWAPMRDSAYLSSSISDQRGGRPLDSIYVLNVSSGSRSGRLAAEPCNFAFFAHPEKFVRRARAHRHYPSLVANLTPLLSHVVELRQNGAHVRRTRGRRYQNGGVAIADIRRSRGRCLVVNGSEAEWRIVVASPA